MTTWTDVSTTETVFSDDGDLSGYVDHGYMATDYTAFTAWTAVDETSTSWSAA